MQYALGIDIGTGSTKAVAISLSGITLATARIHYQMISLEDGYQEQYPENLWEAFVNSINEIVKKTGDLPVIVSLSSAMHGIMAIDKNNEPITNLITWSDERSGKIAAEI